MAEPALIACQYVLIRLAPSPIREEAVTIGVALFEPQMGGFTGVRVRPGELDPALAGLEADLHARLSTAQPNWLSRSYFLEFARESFNHSLRLTDPCLVLTADPAAELDRLYAQYAAPLRPAAEAGPEVRGARRRVLTHLRRVFAEERVLRRLQPNFRAGEWLGSPDRFRFDFHYRGGGETSVHHVIQALPWSSDEGAVKELCFTVERVRRHLGRLDVAAFHDDSASPEAAYFAALLSEADIRMLGLPEAAAEAARIRLIVNGA